MRREAIGSLQKRSQQRGAAAVFAAIAILAMLAGTTLVIDIGRLYLAKQQLQKQADIAALDTVRRVSACSAQDVPTQGELEAIASQSLTRNGLEDIEAENLSVTAGRIDTDGESGFRKLAPEPMETASAVRVTVERALPPALFPRGASTGSQRMRASATAEQPAVGSFFVGSELAALDAGIVNGLLGSLLCAPGDESCRDEVVALNLASNMNGLLDTGVSLGELATALNIKVRDLSDPLILSTKTPVLSGIIDGLAGSLSGTASGTVSTLLQGLGDAVEGNDAPVDLDPMFDGVTDVGASAPVVNLFELLVALGQAATPTGDVVPVRLPVGLHIPNVTSLHAFVETNAPPSFSGMGRPGVTQAESASLTLKLRLMADAHTQLANGLTLLLGGGLLGSVDAHPIRLGIDVDVAKAIARLEDLQCPRPGVNNGEPIADLDARASAANVTLGTFLGNPQNAPEIESGSSELLGLEIDLLGGLLASIKVNVFLEDAVSLVAGNQSFQALPYLVTEFERLTSEDEQTGGRDPSRQWQALDPSSGPGNPQEVGSENILAGTMSSLFSSLQLSATDPDRPDSSTVCVLLLICLPVGDILDVVLDAVTAVLQPILTGVGGIVDALLDPLLKLLGVQVGNATVTMYSVSVAPPHLVTTEVPTTGDLGNDGS